MKNNMKNNMKNTILTTLLLLALTSSISSNAQVGIGVTTANMAASAMLDVSSTTKGFLPPRMTYAQRNAIVTPGAGLIVYCTDCGSNGGEAEFYNGTVWVSMFGLQGSLPTLAPTSSITVGNASATSGGAILTDGGLTIYFRGVCWSTSSNPTIALSTKTVDGTGIGTYTSAITGLTNNTTYYVRSYATNAAGTAYGNEEAFTSVPLIVPPSVPTISTSSIYNFMAGTATCGGNVSADGNATITARGLCWSTNSNPTIALSTKTFDGTGTGCFSSAISGLTDNTTYYVRAYATNATGTAYGNEEVYTVIPGTIGTQVWTTQNLNVSTYRDGTTIPQVSDPTAWFALTTGAWCYYNNTTTNGATYGKLYNWYAVIDARGLAPVGYHIPTDEEWTTLSTTLGGESVAGAKMKSLGTALWNTPNAGATNSSGFEGLPGGMCNNGAGFYDIRNFGRWWSSTVKDASSAWTRSLYSVGPSLLRDGAQNTSSFGYSVRCVKD
jgi:uncharacterized protein (TIGR02145 family)